MYIKTEEKQKYIEENIRVIRELLEKHFDLYIQKEIDEENKIYDKSNNNTILDTKNKIKDEKNKIKKISHGYNHRKKEDLKVTNNIQYMNAYVEGKIFLNLPAVKRNKKFNFKQYSRVYLKKMVVIDGKITITGFLRKKYIYTAMIKKLPITRYGLIKDMPFECKVYSQDIKESDIYDIIPNIKINTEFCKLGCFSKNAYGEEIANCCIEKDNIRIGIVRLN